MGGGLGVKGGDGVDVEGDPDGATDVRAAAALLCRETEALRRVSALCSHHLPSALFLSPPPLKASSLLFHALLRSLQHR